MSGALGDTTCDAPCDVSLPAGTDVVVARYAEDLAWLEPIAHDCVVYNKGAPIAGTAFRALVELPNVGREAHTYLHHIVTNYDRLADVTVFVQGCIADHVHVAPVAFVVQLAREALASGMSGNARELQECGYDFRLQECYGPLAQYGDMCLGEWYEHCTGVRYAPCGTPMWYEKALFAASRAAIRAVPLLAWRRMLESVCDHVNPVVAHYLERTWYHVLDGARAPTFVTCFVDVYCDAEPRGMTPDWRMAHFVRVAETGVRIVAYGDESTLPMLRGLKRDNVWVLQLDYKSTPTYGACKRSGLALPATRHATKDTAEYMALMNAKIEFVQNAIELNPWGSRAFAWFDFSMAYLFKSSDTLGRLGRLAVYDATFLAFPGCWDKGGELFDSVNWRFCGTFFVGDVASLSRFHETYRRHLPRFLELHGKLVWEVNFWAWLEESGLLEVIWYAADHNDMLISKLLWP